jgi:hypothetical protein
MTAPTTSAQAHAYLTAVAAHLADLPEGDRAELLEDLTMHLVALEEEHDERSLEARLGTADSYAAELRAAAGLPARASSWVGVSTRLRTAVQRARGSRLARETSDFLPQLLPAWWVLRGYLLVLLPCLAGVSGARDFPVPAPAGSHALGVVLVLVATVASVALGRRKLPRLVVPVVVLVDLALVVASANVLASAPERLTVHRYRYVNGQNPFHDSPLVSAGRPVTDIYPYTLAGAPLTDVLLYDQDGRPLETGKQLWWRDHCRRVLAQPQVVGGIPVQQVYPKHYVLDPTAVTLSGMPITPGQCKPVPRPAVVLPTLAPTTSP